MNFSNLMVVNGGRGLRVKVVALHLMSHDVESPVTQETRGAGPVQANFRSGFDCSPGSGPPVRYRPEVKHTR